MKAVDRKQKTKTKLRAFLGDDNDDDDNVYTVLETGLGKYSFINDAMFSNVLSLFNKEN